jgi:CheY-like chemotaxis protein
VQDKKILVIEDNELNMKLVVALLRIGKYEILQATDAETGIRLARDHRPALIVMDLQLPGMDGLTATRLIKEDETLHCIPIVALTSHAMQGDEEKARAAGCTRYIPKPIDTRGFLQAVKEVLDGQDEGLLPSVPGDAPTLSGDGEKNGIS